MWAHVCCASHVSQLFSEENEFEWCRHECAKRVTEVRRHAFRCRSNHPAIRPPSLRYGVTRRGLRLGGLNRGGPRVLPEAIVPAGTPLAGLHIARLRRGKSPKGNWRIASCPPLGMRRQAPNCSPAGTSIYSHGVKPVGHHPPHSNQRNAPAWGCG